MVDTLRSRIRKIQDDTGLLDPHQIAPKLVGLLSQDEIVDAVASYIRVLMNTSRRGAVAATPQASAKVAAVQSWYEKMIDQVVDVSGDQGQWKRLAECTRDDILAIA